MRLSLGRVVGMTLVWTGCLVAAEFPVPYNSEPDIGAGPMPAAEAAAKFRMPPGFKVQVFAAEPDVQNPIAMTWDRKGRIWVAENYTYAERAKKFELALRDRIVIFADENGDGKFDSRRVFTDEVQHLTSVEVGRGGVWVMAPPQLLFIPDADANDIPDAPPHVILDGFTVPADNYHNFANGLRWGPDGWLYGRCGASAPGEVGKPGAPAEERIPLRGGLWRYHPVKQTFEVLAHGTTNPWGHDWNEYGEAFFINTVNGHLWHAFPGAHFPRSHTNDTNRRVYETIPMHADHWHWDTGKHWTDSRKVSGEHDRLGGGHAHIGCTIYLGDNWPKEYYGRLMTANMHGRRINVERLERVGSGYLARHEPDIFFAADPWFRAMELSYGPDGGLFVFDWSDTGECHDNNGVHRQSGRIFKMTYGDVKPAANADLTKLPLNAMVRMQLHPNEWYARQARFLLDDRFAKGEDLTAVRKALRSLITSEKDPVRQLRCLWTLYSIDGADTDLLRGLLAHENEHVRVAAIKLLSDHWPIDSILSFRPKTDLVDSSDLAKFVSMAETDPSGIVRLALSSTLNRLPFEQRETLAAKLSARTEDANDQNLPIMIWCGLIPVADRDLQAIVRVAQVAKMPDLRKFIARRLAEDIEKTPAPLDALVKSAAQGSSDFQNDVLNGLVEGLAGWRKAPAPASWSLFQTALAKSTDVHVQNQLRDLSVLFGDGRALDEVKKIVFDEKAEFQTRRDALETLIANRPADLRETCEKLLGVRYLNMTAVRGLASFSDPSIGDKLAKSYRSFLPPERPSVIETLVSRPAFAKALLQQIGEGKIARADLSAFQARQIRGFNDPALSEKLAAVWGELRDSADDKRQAMTALKTRLVSGGDLAKADKTNGRVVFNQVCSACHRLYGIGGAIGPDLTGAGRSNVDYLLENIIDPSAVVTADFRMSVAALADGQIINGIVVAKTDKTVTLQTAKERIVVQRDEIEQLEPSKLSLMPEGMLQPLSPDQVRDLFAYLMHSSQMPLPEGAPTAVSAK